MILAVRHKLQAIESYTFALVNPINKTALELNNLGLIIGGDVRPNQGHKTGERKNAWGIGELGDLGIDYLPTSLLPYLPISLNLPQ